MWTDERTLPDYRTQWERHRDLVLDYATRGFLAKHGCAEPDARFQVGQNLDQWVEYNAGNVHDRWVAAFTAYRNALAQPYFDQDDESRASNRAEVDRAFQALCALVEE